MYFYIKSSIGTQGKVGFKPPVVYSTDRSKAVVLVLVLLFVALWFILGSDLFYVLPCVIFFLCFSALLALWLPRLGKRELILVFFVRLFDLCLFGLLVPLPLGVWEGLQFADSLDFSLQCFYYIYVHRHCQNKGHLGNETAPSVVSSVSGIFIVI